MTTAHRGTNYWLSIISDNGCCDELSTANNRNHGLAFGFPSAILLPKKLSDDYMKNKKLKIATNMSNNQNYNIDK
uniref:Uncharacterized protein n=1 Tax=Rhizophora mucronata TaxID=61149 RepID=A0A2P2M8V2_RHIMU